MKHSNVFICFLFQSIHIASSNTSNTQSTPPIIINNINTPYNTSSNQTTSTIASQNIPPISDFHHYHHIQLPDMLNSFKNWYDSYTIETTTKYKTLPSLKENKIQVIVASIVSSYSYFYYYIYKTEQINQNTTTWCNWKQNISIESLKNMPTEELLPQFILDIQKKYLFSQHEISYNRVLEQFLSDISKEHKQLTWYVSIQKYAQKFYCSKLFYFKYNIVTIEQKLERLKFLLELFEIWQTKEISKGL